MRRKLAEELHRRQQLQVEAIAEAQKEAALIEQVVAAAPKDRRLSLPETMELIKKFQKEEQADVKGSMEML